jgi:hypothetical protein
MVAEFDVLTIGLDDLADFKKDKDYNAVWADRGLYVVLSKNKNSFFSITATVANNLTTINPSSSKLPKFDGGVIVFLRRKDRAFTDYEAEWVNDMLFDLLKTTDLDFAVTKSIGNPIKYNTDKQDDLIAAFDLLSDEFVTQGYDFGSHVVFDEEVVDAAAVRTDQVSLDGFAGVFNVNVAYDKNSGAFSLVVKDRSIPDGPSIFSTRFVSDV